MPANLTEQDQALWKALDKILKCEKHEGFCIIDTKGRRVLHIPCSYEFREVWIKYIVSDSIFIPFSSAKSCS